MFIKVMKPVFATLRGKGHLSSTYLDDSWLAGYSYEECKSNIEDTTNLLRELGLYPHEDKSVTYHPYANNTTSRVYTEFNRYDCFTYQ
jgi:hypothetical protein